MIPVQPRGVVRGFHSFNDHQASKQRKSPKGSTPRRGLSVIDVNSYNESPRFAIKPSQTFQTPPRPTQNKSIKSSPRLVRVRSPFDENDHVENSSDEEEIFFGTVTQVEQTKATKLRKSRRRTMIQSSKTKKKSKYGVEQPVLARRAEYAAIVIQSNFRMYQCRTNFLMCRGAAIHIQAWFRGCSTRKQLIRNMETTLNERQHHQQLDYDHEVREEVSSPRSPAELCQHQSFFNEIDVQPIQEPELAIPLPLTGFEAKMERLRQLREKRKRLELKLSQGKSVNNHDAVETDNVDKSDDPTRLVANTTQLQVLRNSLFKPRSVAVSRTQPHHTPSTTAAEVNNNNNTNNNNSETASKLSLFKFARIARRTNGNVKNVTTDKTIDQELDRVTRLNTARNSTSNLPANFRNQIATFVEVHLDDDSADYDLNQERKIKIVWSEPLISDGPHIPTNKCVESSILKPSQKQHTYYAKTVVERQTLRLLVGSNNTMSTAI